MGYSVDILNNIRLNASDEYQDRIPEATRNNIAEIGNSFAVYTHLFNEFCDALINKIGKTIVETKMFQNKLARFKSGAATPHDVEEIFVEMAKAEGDYDPEGKNPLGRRDPVDVKVMYHRENRRDKYVISIGDLDFIRVFRNEDSLGVFIKAQINALYSGDNYDEWLAMKNLLGTYDGYFTVDVEETSDKALFAKNFIKALRKCVNDGSFPSREYNAAKVLTQHERADMVLFVNKDVTVECDVELLAHAFNKSDTDTSVVPEIVIMDDFGPLADTYAILAPADFFKVWDTLFRTETQRNADGLFTNYFLHHHQILSLSKFKNAFQIKKKA